MSDLELINTALSATMALSQQYPESRPVSSAVEQLEYLVTVENGSNADRSFLPNINLGLIAAREVDDMDPDVADLLYKVQALVKRML